MAGQWDVVSTEPAATGNPQPWDIVSHEPAQQAMPDTPQQSEGIVPVATQQQIGSWDVVSSDVANPSFMDQMGGGVDSLQSSFQKTGALIADKVGADDIAQGLRSDAAANDAEAASVQHQSKHGETGWKQALNLSDPDWWKATIAEAIPGSAPFLAGAVAGAAATPFPHPIAKLIGAGLGGGAAVVLQEVGPAYQDFKKVHPDDESGAVDYAVKKAGLSGIINAASVGLGPLGYSAGAIKHALVQMAIQPAVGVADTVAGNAMEQASIDPNTDLSRGVAKSAVGEIVADVPGTVAITRSILNPDNSGTTESTPQEANSQPAGEWDVVSHEPVSNQPTMAEADQAAPKIAEPNTTIDAQLDSFNAGDKPAVLITKGEQMPQIPEGAKTYDIESGTLIYKDDATLAKALNPETLGEALGYGTGAKPENPTGAVVSKDAEGRIVAEQVTDETTPAIHLPVMDAAQKLAGEGGTVEQQPIEQVLQTRMEATEAEGQSLEGGSSQSPANAALQPETSPVPSVKDMLNAGVTFRKGEAFAFNADAKNEASTIKTEPAEAIAIDDVLSQSPNNFQDTGKIGGARKDIARKHGSSTAKKDAKPKGWKSRYHISEIQGEMIRSGGYGSEMVDSPNNGKFIVFDNRKKGSRHRMPQPLGRQYFESEEAAAEMLPILAVARNHSVYADGDGKFVIKRRVTERKRVRVIADSFDSREKAMKYMVENAEDIITTKLNFGEEILPKPEAVMRKGESRRSGNVKSSDEIKDTFGFKEVEFGKWENQEERQEVVNHAYDSLVDLAEVLDIPAQAIGLNGDLSLAFGARGEGLSGAAAHYERNYAVINLTKMSGAGHLAHEWLHSLDHYIGRLDGKASSEKITNSRGNEIFNAKEPAKDYASHGFKYSSAARKEVVESYEGLMRTILQKSKTYVEDSSFADEFLERARNELQKDLAGIRSHLSEQLDPQYWKRKNKPATEEQLTRLDELVKQIISGEQIETEFRSIQATKSRTTHRMTNDALEEISTIFKAVRGRTGFQGTGRGKLDHVRSAMDHYAARIKTMKEAKAGVQKERTIPTDFKLKAKEADQGRGGSYWATNHELAARAFAAYIEDRLAGNKASNDFLAYHAHGAVIAPVYPDGFFLPYPEGAERKAINKAFDKLFKTLKTKETEKGVALFSVNKSAGSGSVIPHDTVKAIVKRITTRAGLVAPVSFHHSEATLPQEIRDQADKDGATGSIDGVYYDGRVHIVTSHIKSKAHAEEVLLHEAFGHYGAARLFGKDMDRAFNRLFLRLGGVKGIKELAEQNGLKMESYFKNAEGMSKERKALYLADELLAQLQGKRAYESLAQRIKNALKQFWGAIRQMLKKVGFIELSNFSDSDVALLLSRTHKAATLRKNIGQKGRPVFSARKPNEKHESIPDGMGGFDGFVDVHNKKVKALAWDSVMGFAKDKRRVLMGILTNLQLVEVYSPAFKGMEGGNPLSQYATWLQKLEAERNGALHEAELIDQKWDKLNSKEADEVGKLLNDATMAQVSPDKAFESQMPALQKQLKEAKTEAAAVEAGREINNEHQREKAYPNIAKRYKALSTGGKGVYRNVRDLYSDQWNKTRDAMIERVGRSIPDAVKRKQSMNEIRLAFMKKIQIGDYAPLARFGDYVVISRKGDDYIRDHFAASAQQKAAAAKYRKAGFTVSELKGEEFGAGDLGNAPAFAQDVFELLEKYGLKQSDLADDVNQLMLKMMPDMSALKHNIHRKRIKGYSGDARRAFAHTVFHGAHHLSRIMYADRMQNEITRIKDEIGVLQSGKDSSLEDGNLAVDLLNEMKARHEKIMAPNSHPLTSWLGSLGFIWYLGASPAAGVVNMTQTPLVTLPMLAGKHGWAKSSAALMRAMKDYARAPFKAGSYEAWVSLDRSKRIVKSERLMIDELIKDGTLDITQAHALAQLSETDTRHNSKGEMSRGRTKAMRYVGAFFHNAEVVNRQVSALAAYRLAKTSGATHEQAVDQARKIVFDSHFNYASSNRPRYLKGDVVRTLTMFKQYSQHMSYALLRNFNQSFKGESAEVQKQARKTLAGILGMHTLAAGTLGLPLVGVIFSALDLAFDDDDEPFDSKTAYRNWLADTFGAKAGEAIAKGSVNAYTGLELHSRVSLDELWLRTPDRDMSGKQEALYYLEQAAGPVGALFLNIWSGAGSIAEGHVERGFEKMVPKFVRDFARAARYHEEGITTYRGDPIVKDTTAAEEAAQALGFAPARAGERYEARSAVKKLQSGINNRRGQLLDWYAEGIRDNDNEKRNEVIEKISRFNQKNPSRVIDAKTLKRSLKTRAVRSAQTDRGIYLPKT